MAIEWLRNLTESDEAKTARLAAEKEAQLAELKETPEFRNMLADTLRDIKEQEKEEALKEKREHEERVQKAKLDVELVGESMQDSPEPFANVLAMGFSKEHGIQVKLDFNPAFIRYLKTFGIEGSNDEDTIRIWLAHMADDIIRTEQAQDYLINGVDESEKPSMNYEEMFEMEEGEENDEDDDNRWEQPPS